MLNKSQYLLFFEEKPEYLDSLLASKTSFANKNPYCQSYGFSSSHVWMWELDHMLMYGRNHHNIVK